MKIQRVENLNVSLKYIREKGIKLVSIGGEDIYAGNLKLILGLIWTLILRFQIATDDDPGGTKAALLEWVNRQINPQVCSFFFISLFLFYFCVFEIDLTQYIFVT